jgi:membrane-bound lytic murein transglycosylase F
MTTSVPLREGRYSSHVDRINRQAIAHLVEDIQTLLPHYRKHFQDAQAATGIDWRLLAAVAYQESKWDPQATSPTGVRGIMMLTEETADRLGVSNRLDPVQSISAGSRYLASLRDLLPEDLREPDRTWHALAAYNLGLGHWNGARQIGESMKRDTRSWFEMKKVLPLMAKPEFYGRLKSGRARGGEAVIMVENIRNYYDILSRFQPAWQPVQGLGFKGAAGATKPAAGKIGLKAGGSIGLRLPPGLAP